MRSVVESKETLAIWCSVRLKGCCSSFMEFLLFLFLLSMESPQSSSKSSMIPIFGAMFSLKLVRGLLLSFPTLENLLSHEINPSISSFSYLFCSSSFPCFLRLFKVVGKMCSWFPCSLNWELHLSKASKDDDESCRTVCSESVVRTWKLPNPSIPFVTDRALFLSSFNNALL